ncbi:MAG: GtrA family protein [Eubacteriales bacterium]
MLKFVGSSCISFLVDISLYSILIYLFFQGDDTAEDVMIASIMARLISSVVNFTLNYKTVFSSEERLKVAIIKYYTLATTLMLISSFVTGIMVEWSQMPVLMKLLVDGTLFVLSYSIQKHYIFGGKGRRS